MRSCSLVRLLANRGDFVDGMVDMVNENGKILYMDRMIIDG